jgi:anti-sigma B factor antagonist
MEVRVPEAVADGRPYVVEVSGDLDIATVDELEGPVIGAVENGRGPLMIDLSECTFIDSSGIRLLLRAHRRLRANDGLGPPMAIIARDHVAKLLLLTAVDKVLPVVGSRGDAERVLAGVPARGER